MVGAIHGLQLPMPFSSSSTYSVPGPSQSLQTPAYKALASPGGGGQVLLGPIIQMRQLRHRKDKPLAMFGPLCGMCRWGMMPLRPVLESRSLLPIAARALGDIPAQVWLRKVGPQ